MTHALPTYPAYRDSGVDWLGEIPAHWEMWKISHIFRRIGSGTTPPSDEQHWYEGDIPWVQTSELREVVIRETGKMVTSEALARFPALKLFPPATLLVAMYGATIGRLGILGVDACVNQACCALADPDSFDVGFIFYWLLGIRDRMVNLASGGGQPNINQEKIKALRVSLPSAQEQRAIAAFLDRETARLDALIGKKERLLALLAEKRAALISHAVTKGLDPSVPMRDSGVTWLGEIPAHWGTARISDIAHSLQTGPFGSQLHAEEYVTDGIPIINPAHLRGSRIQPDRDCTVDQATWLRLARHELLEGDIIFARRGEMGRCALVTTIEQGWLCGSGSLRLRPKRDLADPVFLSWMFSTSGVAEWLSLESVGTTMDNLSAKIIGQVPLPIPPLSEQLTIADYLNLESGRINGLSNKVTDAIEKLREYRAALIAAAVTGKIDVRGEAAVHE